MLDTILKVGGMFDWITPAKALIKQDLLNSVSTVATDDFDTIRFLESRGIKCTDKQHSYIIGKGWVYMFSVPREDEDRVRHLLSGGW
jgi:hypothetical protein